MARVLLIEPDMVLGKTYRDFLAQHGHTVQLCQQAQQAVDVIDRRKPSVIVLELQLADHAGIEFLYELRSYPEWAAIPIVVQTLVPPQLFSDNVQQIEKLGVTQYLYKPVTTLAHLARAVETAQAPIAA